jgi:hypothetical protein
MSTYQDLLIQSQNLTPNEQERLLEDLAKLIRQQPTIKPNDDSQELPNKPDLDRWFGFLPQRVDPVEFQHKLRQEWDE